VSSLVSKHFSHLKIIVRGIHTDCTRVSITGLWVF